MKAVIVIVGYVVALAGALVLTRLFGMAPPGTSDGMAAGGEALFFLAAFLFLSIAPTILGFVYLRRWRMSKRDG